MGADGLGDGWVHMAKDLPLKLLLIRSGPTCWDEDGRVQGTTDLPLSELGERSCRETARCIFNQVGVTPSVVIAGPDEACRQTAELIGICADAKVRVVDDLSEVCLGLWEGLRESELESRFPRAAGQWLENPCSVQPPEGELILDARDRVVAALEKAMKKWRNGCIAVVLRPVVYGMVRCLATGRDLRDLWELARDPAGFDLVEPRDGAFAESEARTIS